MGRRPTISRGTILDAAERVVAAKGGANFTIEAVAAEAGVSKGGVLYAYPTKDALIDAMFKRVFAAFDDVANTVIAELGDTPEGRTRGHVESSRLAIEKMTERSAALLVNYMRSPHYRTEASDYYRTLLGQLDTSSDPGRRLRLAVLACEGAFLLQGFDFHRFTEKEWAEIHADIAAVLLK